MRYCTLPSAALKIIEINLLRFSGEIFDRAEVSCLLGDSVRSVVRMSRRLTAGTPRWAFAQQGDGLPFKRSRAAMLADTLTFNLLEQVWRGRGNPPPFLVSNMTSSIEALRAFLEGARAESDAMYRHAVAAYQRAIDADSTFWLAYWRYASAQGWMLLPVPREYRYADHIYHRGGFFGRPMEEAVEGFEELVASIFSVQVALRKNIPQSYKRIGQGALTFFWAARGAWDSALVALDNYGSTVSSDSAALDAYRIAWAFFVDAFESGTAARRSGAALEAAATMEDLQALLIATGDTGMPYRYPSFDPIVRMQLSQWHLEEGDGDEAVDPLLWNESVYAGDPAVREMQSALRRLVNLRHARAEEARGRPERAAF